jgi:hypothetical protein
MISRQKAETCLRPGSSIRHGGKVCDRAGLSRTEIRKSKILYGYRARFWTYASPILQNNTNPSPRLRPQLVLIVIASASSENVSGLQLFHQLTAPEQAMNS